MLDFPAPCFILKCQRRGFKEWNDRWYCQMHYERFTQVEGNRKIPEFFDVGPLKRGLSRKEFKRKEV